MPAPVGKHPFRAAWETRDGAAWREALGPAVRLNSPIVESPFVGRDAVGELYEVLFDALGPVTITSELPAEEGATVFFWRADLDCRTIEGIDVVRRASDGSVAEITVFIRPLVGIGAFAEAVGPPLAARLGNTRGVLLRILSAPLVPFLFVVDRAATALIRR